jgi:hypothetical protein
MKILYITAIDEWMYPNIIKILMNLLKEDFKVVDIRRNRSIVQKYIKNVDASITDHVTINQPEFVKIKDIWLNSSTIRAFIDDSEFPFLYNIIF